MSEILNHTIKVHKNGASSEVTTKEIIEKFRLSPIYAHYKNGQDFDKCLMNFMGTEIGNYGILTKEDRETLKEVENNLPR